MENYNIIADQYDDMLATDDVATINRAKFRTLVTSYVPRDHLLVDFGGGTGMDAEFYAQQGYDVILYEPSHGMRRVAKDRVIKRGLSGKIEVSEDSFPDLLKMLSTLQRSVSIVSNFGPLNHLSIPDTEIGQLAAVVSPHGYFIHYILRPFYLGFIRKKSFMFGVRKILMNESVSIRDGGYILHLFRVKYLRRRLSENYTFLTTVKSHPYDYWRHRSFPSKRLLDFFSRRSVFVVFRKNDDHENN